MRYHHILVTVDGSKVSEYAFFKALNVAKRNEATLHVAHIIDIRTYASVESDTGSIHEQAVKYTEKFLKGYQDIATKEGVQCETHYDSGSAKQIIPKQLSEKVSADLIICGSNGYNRVERFIMGSVSEAIVRFAKCDVLVVRTENMPDNYEITQTTQNFQNKLKEA